jgi:hypothetical protein
MSLSCHQSHVWIKLVSRRSCSFLVNSIGSSYQHEGECKSTSPSEIQVKNQQKTISTGENLYVISWHEKVNELLTCAIMLDSLMVAYLQFVIVVTELKKVLSQEVKCLCSEITTVLSDWIVPKLWMWVSYVSVALEINILCRNVYIWYIHYIYSLQVHISTSGIVVCYIGWGFQSPKPPRNTLFWIEILCLICLFFRCVTLV